MTTAYTEEQVALSKAYSHLVSLREASTDLLNFVDFSDSVTFDSEDGTPSTGITYTYQMAFSQALMRPSATACVYINEQQLRLVRARSRAFCSLSPYWMSVRENLISYTIGTGHVYSVSARRKGITVSDDLRQRVEDELEQFCQINQYRQRQGEKLTRLDRDGEYFLRFFEDRPDGILRVRFVEPLLVQTPPNRSEVDDVWFGIQFAPGDYEEPLRYHVRTATYTGTNITDEAWQEGILADQIQHRKVNVDMGSPRGVPTTYALQETCQQALSTLKSMGRLVDIRARIALIRKQANATLSMIQPLLNRSRIAQSNSTSGTLRNVFGMPYGAIIDTNDQRTLEFPTQHIETDKIVHALKADLQAVASAVGLADFCLSADASAAFANSLVKEGPMDRAICRRQQDTIDDDKKVYERALQLAIKKGRLDSDTLDKIRLDIHPPKVIARNRIQDTQADEILVRNGAMSITTMSMRDGLDPRLERQMAEENPSPVLTAGGTGDTRSNQAPIDGKATARGLPSGSEPGPAANAQKQ